MTDAGHAPRESSTPSPARWTVTVEPAALRVPAEYLRDRDGLTAFFDALDALGTHGPGGETEQPFPDTPHVHRVRVGLWRALCEIDRPARLINVVNIGRREKPNDS